MKRSKKFNSKKKERDNREKEWETELELEESMFNMLCQKKNICYTEDISEKYLEKEDNYSKITTQKKENIKDEIIKNTSTYITSPIKKSNEVRKAAALLIGGTVDNTTYLDQRLEKLMDDCEITIKSKQVSADLALIRQEFHKQKNRYY